MYPSIITSFTYPTPTDKLNSPSHSALHNTTSSALGQVQAVIGLSTSSAVGTLFYDVRSPDSNGGGHVQSANKGGTGQTSFTKGDIFVATSSSVIAKLSVGADGQGVIANSSTASGLQYQGVATAKTLQDQTNTYASASVVSASVWSITFPNIVSVLSAGQSFAVKFPTANAGSILAIQVSSLVAQRLVLPDLTNVPVGGITPSMIGIIENDGVRWQLVSKNATSVLSAYSTGFGNASIIGLVDTAIQTTNDCFIVGWAPPVGGSAAINILADSSNPPTTVLASILYGGQGNGVNWCVPVKKNDYFIASGTAGTCYKINIS